METDNKDSTEEIRKLAQLLGKRGGYKVLAKYGKGHYKMMAEKSAKVRRNPDKPKYKTKIS